MANPQLEDGYIKIANELVEAFCRYFPGRSEGQVLMSIIRKTLGWNKDQDEISIGQLMKATGLARRTVIYALQNLEAKRMIVIHRNRVGREKNTTNRVSVQKNYDLWIVQGKSRQYANTLKQQKKRYRKTKQEMVQGLEGSARNRNNVVQGTDVDCNFLAPTKDNTTKDNITKDNNYIMEARDVLTYLNVKIGSRYRMLEEIIARLKEGRTVEQCKKLIDKKILDPFFQKNPNYYHPTTLFRKSHWDKYINYEPKLFQGKFSYKTIKNIQTLKDWCPEEK